MRIYRPSRFVMGGSLALLMAASVAAFAQELLPVFPGVTTLGARVVPSPVGVSPEMTKIVAARQIPPDIPVPATTQEWLKLQSLFDAPGSELGRKGAKLAGVTYEVKTLQAFGPMW